MNDKDNFELDFGEKIEDIMSKSKSLDNENEEEILQEAQNEEIIEDQVKYEDISSSSGKKAKKGWWKLLSKWKKAALISVASIILLTAGLYGYVRIRFNYNYDKQFNVEIEQKDENIVNVALFGVDCRDEDDFTGLTDSIMILSINKKTDTIKIISVMRDTFVPILDENEEFKKYGKINSAYASGKEDITKSATIAVNTLNYVYDLDISNYAVINFYGMAEIIDAVGGINATITQDELTAKGKDKPNLNGCMQEICKEKGLNAKDYYITQPGEQKLNGIQAVAYARVRHCRSTWGTNNDYGRTDRQRHVMQELFNKAVKMDKTKYVELVDALIPCSRTSLGPSEIVDLAVKVLLQNPSFEQYRLPPEEHVYEMLMDSPSGYGSVIYYDIDYAARLMNAVIFDDQTFEEFIEENPIERNDWFKTSARPSGGTRPSTNNTDKTSQTAVSSKSSQTVPSSKPSSSDETSKPSDDGETSLPSKDDETSSSSDQDETSSGTTSSETSEESTGSEPSDPSGEGGTSSGTTSSETSDGSTSSDPGGSSGVDGTSSGTTSSETDEPTTVSSQPSTSSEDSSSQSRSKRKG